MKRSKEFLTAGLAATVVGLGGCAAKQGPDGHLVPVQFMDGPYPYVETQIDGETDNIVDAIQAGVFQRGIADIYDAKETRTLFPNPRLDLSGPGWLNPAQNAREKKIQNAFGLLADFRRVHFWGDSGTDSHFRHFEANGYNTASKVRSKYVLQKVMAWGVNREEVYLLSEKETDGAETIRRDYWFRQDKNGLAIPVVLEADEGEYGFNQKGSPCLLLTNAALVTRGAEIGTQLLHMQRTMTLLGQALKESGPKPPVVKYTEDWKKTGPVVSYPKPSVSHPGF